LVPPVVFKAFLKFPKILGRLKNRRTCASIRENTVCQFVYLLDAPLVLLFGLALPGIDGDASLGHGSRCMILGGENVAGRPLDLK
jgi:hypothetical protein